MPRAKAFDEAVVLERAVDLFWTKGYHATSIQDLVSHLGINRASLYDTYGDKQALFQQAFAHYRQTSTAGMKAFLATQESVRSGLRNLFLQNIENSGDCEKYKGCFVVNTTTELMPGDVDMQRILAENQTGVEGIFYEFLQRGENAGELAPGQDLKGIASMLYTINNGLQIVAKVEADRSKLVAAIDSALSVLK